MWVRSPAPASRWFRKQTIPGRGRFRSPSIPSRPKTFSVYVRIPNRTTSKLYTDSPAVRGVKRFAVNGEQVTPKIQKGYAVVTREWKAGDRIELELPMEPQRVVADPRIKADKGLVALKYGPLIYNVEAADNQNIDRKSALLRCGPNGALTCSAASW